MQTLAQWRSHAKTLETLVSAQQQQLQMLEVRLSELQASASTTTAQLESALIENASLLRAAQAILGAESVKDICREFISHMNSIIKSDSTVLYLVDHDRQAIIRSDFHRRPEALDWALDESQISYSELMAGLSGRVLQSGEPLLSLNPDDGLELSETLEKRRQSGSGSLIIIPLKSTTGIIGTVTAHNRITERVFTTRDVDLLMTLAHKAAAAIQRAQLMDEVRQLATTDPLTGLYSRRECLQLARRELSHSKRLGQSASVFMLDVDQFKYINDTYGHLVGDSVLKGIGELCLESQRTYDIVGRYGGDEFFGFFPDTTAPLAVKIAERIREGIAHQRFSTDSGPVSVTLSVGVAVSTGCDDELEALIKRADQALYCAKQHGRNRVSVWSEPMVSEKEC